MSAADQFILGDDEVRRLTGCAQKKLQCKALRELGIKYARRLDGSPVVVRDAVLEFVGITRQHEEKATLNIGAL